MNLSWSCWTEFSIREQSVGPEKYRSVSNIRERLSLLWFVKLEGCPDHQTEQHRIEFLAKGIQIRAGVLSELMAGRGKERVGDRGAAPVEKENSPVRRGRGGAMQESI